MAPARTNDERTVTRTYRAAIKLGDDYVTLEETITLPVTATDEDVAQAVDLGLRIYTAQRAAVEAQIVGLREAQGAPAPITVRDPDSPASEKQRNYIATLQDHLTWTTEQLASYANEQSVDLVTLTKGQASVFIDGLKRLSEERGRYGEQPAQQQSAPAPQRTGAATEKQLQALQKIAQNRRLDLEGEIRSRFGADLTNVSSEQAAALLQEWQRPANGRRPVTETAL